MADQFVKLPVRILSRRDLTCAAKIVYVYIVDRIGRNSCTWPGQRRIASDCGMGVKTVNRAIAELRDAGELVVSKGAWLGPRAKRTSTYSLPSNVVDWTTLANEERSQADHVDVVDAITPTLPNRTHIQTQPSDPTVRLRNRRSADPWSTAMETMTSDTLRTDDFKSAWSAWVAYRAELRKPLTPSTIKRQITTLQDMGVNDAIAAIERSISNGWTGLFPPDHRVTKRTTPARLTENLQIKDAT